MTASRLYCLKNLLTPEAFQNRADFIYGRGDELDKSNSIEDRIHAQNCYKKAERILEQGMSNFPNHKFYHPDRSGGKSVMPYIDEDMSYMAT